MHCLHRPRQPTQTSPTLSLPSQNHSQPPPPELAQGVPLSFEEENAIKGTRIRGARPERYRDTQSSGNPAERKKGRRENGTVVKGRLLMRKR